MPDTVVYPDLLPTTDYDLSADAIHSHSRPGLPSVQVPGFEHEYQLASECPAHLWPHNATTIGMTRYTPPPESVQASRRLLGYINDDGDAVFVHFAFLYTHPQLRCDQCASQGMECVQWWWDGPDQDGKWPSPATGLLVAHECVLCYSKHHACSNRGVHILESERAAIGAELVKDIIRSREEARRKIRPPNGFQTQFTPRIRAKESSRKRLAKRTRADFVTDSEDSWADSTDLASRSDPVAELDLHVKVIRDDRRKLVEENRELKRQIEDARVELAVQSRTAELAGEARAAAQAKHTEELRTERRCFLVVVAQAQAAEKERDQARAQLGRLQALGSTPAHSTSQSQANGSGPILRDAHPGSTDTLQKQIDTLKDTIADQQERLTNRLDEKEKLDAQLMKAERRILDLERQLRGWS